MSNKQQRTPRDAIWKLLIELEKEGNDVATVIFDLVALGVDYGTRLQGKEFMIRWLEEIAAQLREGKLHADKKIEPAWRGTKQHPTG
jgi:hypothetical protein